MTPPPITDVQADPCDHCGLPIVECNARAVARDKAERYLRDRGYGGLDARARVAMLVPEVPVEKTRRAAFAAGWKACEETTGVWTDVDEQYELFAARGKDEPA